MTCQMSCDTTNFNWQFEPFYRTKWCCFDRLFGISFSYSVKMAIRWISSGQPRCRSVKVTYTYTLLTRPKQTNTKMQHVNVIVVFVFFLFELSIVSARILCSTSIGRFNVLTTIADIPKCTIPLIHGRKARNLRSILRGELFISQRWNFVSFSQCNEHVKSKTFSIV